MDGAARERPERFASNDGAESALAEFLEQAASSTAGSGPDGRTWRRDDLRDGPGGRVTGRG